jgi:hypothetical protein
MSMKRTLLGAAVLLVSLAALLVAIGPASARRAGSAHAAHSRRAPVASTATHASASSATLKRPAKISPELAATMRELLRGASGTDHPPCAVEDGVCVRGCAIPVAAAQPRGAAGDCAASTSTPCRELVADTTAPRGATAPNAFCAAKPDELRALENSPSKPKRRARAR